MDIITVGFLIAFGSLFLPPKGEGWNVPDFDSSNVAEAQPIPLQYIGGYTTSTIDPIEVNPYRNQTVGTDSYLTIVQTSSYEFINIQPDEIIPPRFKNKKTPTYFFTVPNNEKVFSWRVPDIFYVLRVTPSSSGFDFVQVVGENEDENTALKTLQDKWTSIQKEYNRMLNDTDVIGEGEQENPTDGGFEDEDGLSGGFGAMNQDTEEGKPSITIIEETRTVDDVNMRGSPFGQIGGY